MILSLLALGTSLALAPVQPVRVIPPAARGARGKICAPLSRHAQGDRKPGARKLIDAPPADLHLAVDRRMDGCPVPALAGTRPR